MGLKKVPRRGLGPVGRGLCMMVKYYHFPFFQVVFFCFFVIFLFFPGSYLARVRDLSSQLYEVASYGRKGDL